MASYVKYESGIENIANKIIDAFGNNDTWLAVIHTDAPVVATDTALSNLTQISGTNGYTTDGTTISYNSTRSGGTITATGSDVTWTASGGNLGGSTTCRYVSIYDTTPTSPADPLVCYYDYSTTFTVADTETFMLDFGASFYTMS